MKVQGPDGTIYEFPDDTKDSEITSFLESQGAPPEPVTPPPAFEPLPATALAVPGGVGAVPGLALAEAPARPAAPAAAKQTDVTLPPPYLRVNMAGIGPFGPPEPEAILESPLTKLGQATLRAGAYATGQIGETATDLADALLQEYGITPPVKGEGLLQLKSYPVTAGGTAGLLLRQFRPDIAEKLDVASGELLSGFTEPGLLATMPLGATRAGAAYFLAGTAQAIPEELQALAEARGAPEVAGQALKTGANLTMGGLLGRGLLKPGISALREGARDASRIQKAAEVYGDVRARTGEGAREVPPEIRGQGVRPEAEGLGEEAQVLLIQASENNERLGLGREFHVYNSFNGDPTHRHTARADWAKVDELGNFVAPGRIYVNRAALEIMMQDTPPEDLPGVIQSIMVEEGIHSLTTPGEAAVYGQTLTRVERAIGRRLYLRGMTEAEAAVGGDYLGGELLRRRVQQLMGLKTTEIADAVGREKWSVRSLEVIANIIRRFREIIGTKAAKAGQTFAQNVLDRAEANLKTAMEAAKAAERAEPRRGAAPEEPSPFEEGVVTAPSDIDPTTGQPYGGEEPFALRRRPEEEVPPVVRGVPRGTIPPESIVPAIRLIGGEVVSGKVGETHPDIIKRENLKAVDIDQRGFSDPTGKAFFLDREAAAQGTAIPTEREPGRLHSTDLNREGEQMPAALRRKPKNEFEAAVQKETEEQLRGRLETLRRALDQLKYGLVSDKVTGKDVARWEADYRMQVDFIEQEIAARAQRAFPAALRRQHDQDMDFARRLLKMDMAQFMKEGTAFNRINHRLGENATWEDVAELHDLRQQAMFAVEDARKEFEARPTEENKTKYVTAMQKPQFYNEALKKHYEVMQGFEPQALDPQTGQPLSTTESLINRLGPSALRRKQRSPLADLSPAIYRKMESHFREQMGLEGEPMDVNEPIGYYATISDREWKLPEGMKDQLHAWFNASRGTKYDRLQIIVGRIRDLQEFGEGPEEIVRLQDLARLVIKEQTAPPEAYTPAALRRKRPTGPEFPGMKGVFGGALTQPERKPAAEALAEYQARAHEPVTIAAVQREADTYFGQTTAPSLKDFAGKMSVRFGAIKPGEARSQFEEGFWRWAERAPGTEVSAMARDLGLAKRLRLESPEGVLRKLADPPPIEPQLEFSGAPTRAKPQVPGITRPHFTLPGRGLYGPYDKPFRGGTPRGTRLLESPAQRLRAQTLATIADKLMTDAEGGRSFLKRSEIDASEDLGDPKIQTKQPVYHEIGTAAQADPNKLGEMLTDDARAFGGEKVQRVIGGKPVTVRKQGFPVSASKRLTVVQHKRTGKVSVVSTYRDGRRGPVTVDPGVPGSDTHTTVAAMLNRYRVIASALLDEPVQNFRKDYKSLSEYQADFGKPARAAAERSLEYELPPEVTEPEVTKVAPPEAVTESEAASIIDQILGEVDKVRSPEDVKLAWENLPQIEPERTVLATGGYLPKPPVAETLPPTARAAIMGLRKLGREILRQNPDIGEGAFLDKLAQQIYENHTKAQSFEEFQRLTMEQSRPPVSEAARLAEARRLTSAQAAEALRPPPKVTGARELTAQPRPEPIPTGPRPEPVGERAPVNPLLTPKEREYVEFEYLRTHPKTPQEYEKMARLYGLEKGEQGPAALRRRAHTVADETRRIQAGIAAWYKRRGTKQDVSMLRDVSDNLSHDQAFRDDNHIRGATRKKQKGLFYGNAQVLAGANPLIAAGAIVPNYNWTPLLRQTLRDLMNNHPGTPHARKLMKSVSVADVLAGRAMFARIRRESIQHMIQNGDLNAEAPSYSFDANALQQLDVFDLLVQKGARWAEAAVRRGGWAATMKGYAWRKAAADLAAELKYARDHWGEADLVETATRMRRLLDRQYDREFKAGWKAKYDTNYLPGRYDAEFFNDNSILFGEPSGRILGKMWRKSKTFRNYYEAIADADGPYISLTRDGANLVAHRIRQGERQIQYQNWWKALLAITDPDSKKPIAIKAKQLKSGGFGSPDREYTLWYPRKGHDPIAVRNSYLNLLDQLTEGSAIQKHASTRFVLEWEQRLKHTILLGDFFHLARLSYYSLAIMGTKAGFRRGLTALEFHEADLPEAVRNGVISQKEAAWATEKIPIRYGNLVKRLNRLEILREFEKNGLNVGRIQDAIYKDLVRNVPLFGRYNKWLFDRYTRGLMAQSAIVEFERQHKANPAIDPQKLMRDISRDTNQFFGSIGRQGWIRHATFQDLSRMMFLAPQWVEGLVDKEIVSASRMAGTPLHLMGIYRKNLNPLGTMGRGIGRGMVAMFALTQVLNLLSKKQPTWENEEGHKFDAWIPTVDGQGLWLSPLAVFNELAHDLVRLGHSKRRFHDAITQIGSNKVSPWGRLAIVFYTGLTPTKEYIPSTPGVWGTAAAQLAPVPISFGKLGQAALHYAMPGVVAPTPPGAVERQMAATLGLKTEPAAQPALLVTRMAEDFVQKEFGKTESIKILPTTEPSYSKLRNALRINDFAAAKRIIKSLEKTRTDRDIFKAMKNWARHPFTGAKKYERQFVAELTPEQQKLYDAAIEQKEMEYQKFLEWFSKQQ